MKPKYLVLIFSLLLFKDMSAQLRINIGVDTTTEKSKLTINFFNKYITDFKEDNEVDYTKYFYNAGACFPLLVPLGCLTQELAVKLVKLENLFPQYLQTYCDFSEPS